MLRVEGDAIEHAFERDGHRYRVRYRITGRAHGE